MKNQIQQNVSVPCCADCDHFGYEGGGTVEQPYPEFWCNKGQWDGVYSYDSLYEKTNCKFFKYTY